MDVGYVSLAIVLLGALVLLYWRSTNRAPLGSDPRARLGSDGFVFEDPHTAIDSEISYVIDTEDGARRRGSFVLNVRKVWVYTGAKPVGIRILGVGPAPDRPRPSNAHGLPAPTVGGHKKTPHVQGKHSYHPDPRPSSWDEPSRDERRHDLLPGEWGGGSFGGRAPDYPETYNEPTETAEAAGADYQGGGGESGGGGSSASWRDESSGGGGSSSWDSGSSSGNDSYPSAY